MGKKVVIFGCSEFSTMIRHYIEKNDQVYAYCADKEYIHENTYDGLPLVAFNDMKKLYPSDKYEMVIAIGYNQMNDIRKGRFIEAKQMGYNIYSYIHPSAIISTSKIGEGNIILENVVIAAGVTIADANIFQIGTVIAHHTTIGSYNFFAPKCAIAGDINITNNCFLGTNCTIKNGIYIAPYSLCGAGSVITQSTDIYSVTVPPRSITLDKNSRDMKLLS